MTGLITRTGKGREEKEESQFACADLTQMKTHQQAGREIMDSAELILFGSGVSSSRSSLKTLSFASIQDPFSIFEFAASASVTSFVSLKAMFDATSFHFLVLSFLAQNMLWNENFSPSTLVNNETFSFSVQ